MTLPTRLAQAVKQIVSDLIPGDNKNADDFALTKAHLVKLLRHEQQRAIRLVVLQKKHYELQLDTEVIEGSERSFEQVSGKIEACDDLLAALRKERR